jgi:hypothetical protein
LIKNNFKGYFNKEKNMIYKKITIGLIAFTLSLPVVLTGCIERTETERVEVQDVDPAPVVVPDRDVDVHVETDQK